jgi:hypothetical protein
MGAKKSSALSKPTVQTRSAIKRSRAHSDTATANTSKRARKGTITKPKKVSDEQEEEEKEEEEEDGEEGEEGEEDGEEMDIDTPAKGGRLGKKAKAKGPAAKSRKAVEKMAEEDKFVFIDFLFLLAKIKLLDFRL